MEAVPLGSIVGDREFGPDYQSEASRRVVPKVLDRSDNLSAAIHGSNLLRDTLVEEAISTESCPSTRRHVIIAATTGKGNTRGTSVGSVRAYQHAYPLVPAVDSNGPINSYVSKGQLTQGRFATWVAMARPTHHVFGCSFNGNTRTNTNST
jgi:hypothetical protein